MRRWVRSLGHPLAAVIPAAWIVAYLAVVSVAPQRRLMEWFGPAGRPYAHPLLLVPVLWGCVSMGLASVVRVRWDWRGLGAHLAHGGVLVLVAGGCWYAIGREHGQAVAQRTAEGWSPVTQYLSTPAVERAVADDPYGPVPADAWRPLGGELRIETARRRMGPGGRVVDDVRCRGVVVDPRGRREVLLGLNRPIRVGPYQVALGRWDGDAVVLQVTTRPGVWAVWWGLGLIVAGMVWAFHVKPLLRGAKEGSR